MDLEKIIERELIYQFVWEGDGNQTVDGIGDAASAIKQWIKEKIEGMKEELPPFYEEACYNRTLTDVLKELEIT